MTIIPIKKNESNVDLKNAFIRLKDGESIHVRLLTDEDFIEYVSHESLAHKIYEMPCITPLGQDCPLCKASKVGGDEWNKALYPRSRYMFAMADLDSGELKIFKATKSQARGLVETIQECPDELNEVAFVFKRTGNTKSTVYSLNAMTTKKFKEVEDAFAKFDGKEADIPFYEERLTPKSAPYLVHLLEEAKFPIEEHFSTQLVAESREIENDSKQ